MYEIQEKINVSACYICVFLYIKGLLEKVQGTVYDFRKPRSIGAALRISPRCELDGSLCITRGVEQIDVFTAR